MHYHFLLAAGISLAAAASSPKIPTMNIAPGVDLPMVGLGTWQYNDTVAEAATTIALDLGYTHIDTALGYRNQAGIARALKASPRTRDSYFITSKIPGGLSYLDAMSNLTESINQLGLEYVDLMLVHYPATWTGIGGKAKRLAEWKAMQDFQKQGKQKTKKAIGENNVIQRFVKRKKIIAVILVPLFFTMALYTLIDWSAGLSISSSAIPSFESINNLFFDQFFTVLILVDVVLLLISFFYTDQFHKIIRNSGFVISTILIRMSFAVTGFISTILIVVAVLFGLAIIAIHNKYEENPLPSSSSN